MIKIIFLNIIIFFCNIFFGFISSVYIYMIIVSYGGKKLELWCKSFYKVKGENIYFRILKNYWRVLRKCICVIIVNKRGYEYWYR